MNFRDVELLSAYLDGQLSPSDSARIESRLAADANLRAVMDDLRAARGLLRQLPARKAPRNFTLSRSMVGAKPPLPRSYPIFRFATTFATILLFLSFAVNGFASRISAISFAAAPAYGVGGGGGGGAPEISGVPAVTEAVITQAPTEPPLEVQALPAEATPSAADSEAPQQKSAETPPSEQEQARAAGEAVIPFAWQVALAFIVLVCGFALIALHRAASRRWR